MKDDDESNIVSLFWWRHKRSKPEEATIPLTKEQKIERALAKQRVHNNEETTKKD